jgi:hypothetical protein
MVLKDNFMKISFSPQRKDYDLRIVKSGETLNIDGIDYDFSVIPDGSRQTLSVSAALYNLPFFYLTAQMHLNLRAFPLQLSNPQMAHWSFQND